ncbi:hypothetical protein Ahy_A03g016247 [Arachis hypogaea]|uniref:Brix domain-containing protein n=1 Tax=Arachis hypogaea TaxID=3818 RepID=A0A445E2P4_ARAHY|nr:hypothetical protein Ahy_A03g016247 [Arachis hypogaea]
MIVLSGFVSGDLPLKLTTNIAGYGSESEAEEEAATVTLSSDVGRVNRASMKSAVKLQEIGPRMTLQLVKVEKGLRSGEVLFSEYGKPGDKGKHDYEDNEMQDNEDEDDSKGSEDQDGNGSEVDEDEGHEELD